MVDLLVVNRELKKDRHYYVPALKGKVKGETVD